MLRGGLGHLGLLLLEQGGWARQPGRAQPLGELVPDALGGQTAVLQLRRELHLPHPGQGDDLVGLAVHQP